MESGEDNKKGLTTQVKVMIVIIAMMIIGIITRWDFIRSEVKTVWNNMFPAQTGQEK